MKRRRTVCYRARRDCLAEERWRRLVRFVRGTKRRHLLWRSAGLLRERGRRCASSFAGARSTVSRIAPFCDRSEGARKLWR